MLHESLERAFRFCAPLLAPTEFFRYDDLSQYALLRGRAGVYKTQNIFMYNVLFHDVLGQTVLLTLQIGKRPEASDASPASGGQWFRASH